MRGKFVRVTISSDDGSKAAPYVNTAHDPVARWIASGRLDQRQKAAIDTVRRLWGLTGLTQRLTGSYGERVAGSVSTELQAARVIDAKDDLKRIEGYFAGVRPWFGIFENCCRFGMQAGVAGSELGMGEHGNEIRAQTIVAFIADIIATKERL